MSILTKILYRFNAISIRISTSFSTELKKKKILKLVWNHKDPKQPKQPLEKRTKLEASYFYSYIAKV